MMATLKKEKEKEAEMNKQVETKEGGIGHVVFIHPNFKGGWFVQEHSYWRLSFSQSKLYLHFLTDTHSPSFPPSSFSQHIRYTEFDID